MTELLTKMHVMYKLHKALKREKSGYQVALYKRFGLVEGLTYAEFEVCVGLLEQNGCLTVDRGAREAPILVFNEDSTMPQHSPEEIIAHAMTCPPITADLLADGVK